MITKEKIGIVLIITFILHGLTYPSIHHIVDEKIFLDIAKNIHDGNFSDFFGYQEDYTHNTPLYQTILSLASPIHSFNVESAEVVTYLFFLALIIGWYYSIPEGWIDKNKFIVLLFANSLLWVYSFRVLLDIPLAFFLSLGMFNLYLFFEHGKKKNYYLGFILTALALFTKESAIMFLPIFSVYFLFKRVSMKNWVLLLLPLIPFAVFSIFQYTSGFPVFRQFTDVAFKATTTHTYYSLIPYSKLPTTVFMIGIFGFGIVSLFLAFKNIHKSSMSNFLAFFLVFYLIWEITFDFLMYANLPRYHTVLMPFITLVITNGNKKLYYLTLFYTLLTGFLASYYFSTETTEIWRMLV